MLVTASRNERARGAAVPPRATKNVGTFLRAFTFGHVRQLDALLGHAIERAWKAGAGPGAGRLVIDVDSFVGEVCGYLKQGAAYGYTKLFDYHPILATPADTREALHIRLRKGSANTQKSIKRFCEELIARVERAGATGVKPLRADSGLRRPAVDRPAHPPDRFAGRVVARLAALRVHHQPHRRARRGRGRAPRPRRCRTGHRRPQKPSARTLPPMRR